MGDMSDHIEWAGENEMGNTVRGSTRFTSFHRERRDRMTEGTRTPAQQDWEDRQANFYTTWHGSPLDRTVWNRAEEVASDVRALAATVAELKRFTSEFYNEFDQLRYSVSEAKAVTNLAEQLENVRERFAALERGQETLSQSVQSLDRDHVGLKGRIEALEYQRDRADADADDLEQIRSRVLPQSPGSAEAALDPVLVAIKLVYESDPSTVLKIELRKAFRRRSGWPWNQASITEIDAAIRAYGGDTREGGK